MYALSIQENCNKEPVFYPSVFAHSRLGPKTMAILLGVILLTSLS